ncbi:hypothetical protein PSACC_03039 [Paramicrosporidium saccamoebae]|uniref:Uncharacterized protein n=1 Tax=Paramicrosporidium saccamoebae TaxID=1246581 RepID=A0A2H9TH92_9FUNG|nr:hypothetical protein PSACC_03039 [Paramicrosporidium saccamoebae]
MDDFNQLMAGAHQNMSCPQIWFWVLSLLIFGLALNVEFSIRQLSRTIENPALMVMLKAVRFTTESALIVASILAYPERNMLTAYRPTRDQADQLLLLVEDSSLHNTLFGVKVLRMYPQLLEAVSGIEYAGDFWEGLKYEDSVPCQLDSQQKMQLWKMASNRLGSMSRFSFWEIAIGDASTDEELWHLFDLIFECDLNPVFITYLYSTLPSKVGLEFIKRLLNIDSKSNLEIVLRCVSASALLESTENVDELIKQSFQDALSKVTGDDPKNNVQFVLLKRLMELEPEHAHRSLYGALLYLSRLVYWEDAAESTQEAVFSVLQNAIPRYIAPVYFKSKMDSFDSRFSLPETYLPDRCRDLSFRRLFWLRKGPVSCVDARTIQTLNTTYGRVGLTSLVLSLALNAVIPLNMSIKGVDLDEIILKETATIVSNGSIDGSKLTTIFVSWAYLISRSEKRPFGKLFHRISADETWTNFFATKFPDYPEAIKMIIMNLQIMRLFSIQDLRQLVDSDHIETER